MPVKVCWVLAVVCAVLGVAAGLVTSTVNSQGQPVACGPALFHDWVDLPSTDCALAHQPFQTIATVLLVGSVVLAVAGLILAHGDAEHAHEEKQDETGPSDRLRSR
jgi:hypothetical protein